MTDLRGAVPSAGSQSIFLATREFVQLGGASLLQLTLIAAASRVTPDLQTALEIAAEFVEGRTGSTQVSMAQSAGCNFGVCL